MMSIVNIYRILACFLLLTVAFGFASGIATSTVNVTNKPLEHQKKPLFEQKKVDYNKTKPAEPHDHSVTLANF
ncbi:hypothetical protein [Fangia hongkongensis]|uniref:hypothetical protein n=1 Tax=Fangia hongkongensis TaxID=270495 RepID=UPI000369E185|nr:hypothetical protein [Fangia hongkongensis]MBK2126145.1 hypothetical protein [Fangia hongkongensis]